MSWAWDKALARYRDSETGKFLPRQRVFDYVAESIENGRPAMQQLAEYVSNGTLSPRDWQAAFREELKGEYIRQACLAVGGRDQMTKSDWGVVGNALRKQYNEYLKDFTAEVGDLSQEQIAARSQMYLNSARTVFEKLNAKTQGVPYDKLPAIPGDGSCLGLTNCACSWEFAEALGEDGQFLGWDCYWRLGAAEHCELCLEHTAEWNPFFIAA